MDKATRIWIILPLVLAICVSAAGLAAMAGLRFWPQSALRADLVVQNFTLPQSYDLDATLVSDELSAVLQQRAQRDFAIRTLLGTEGQAQVAELIVPRLLNAGVIRRLIEDMDTLGTVIEVGEYAGLITGQVHNGGTTNIDDIVLTLPGAMRVESSDGTRLEIAEPEPNLFAIKLGALAAGQSMGFTAWTNQPANLDSEQFVQNIRLGGAGGLDGTIEMRGPQTWFGAPLQVLPWARWMVASMLAIGLVLSTAILIYFLSSWVRRNRRA